MVAMVLVLTGAEGCAGARHGSYQSGPDEGSEPTTSNTPESPWEPETVGLASRTRGVAPLYVFFDATQDDSLLGPPEVDGHREFADVQYDWDFGDGEAGRWGTSGLSKNRASGYVAAHVYEAPGSYDVTLSVRTEAGDSEQHTVNILVEDPNMVYAGQSTTCVSATGLYDGCPPDAQQLTTNDLAEALGHLGTGRRVLLRRGERWSSDATVPLTASGPMTLGAFGDCTSPSRLGICANAPVLEATGSAEGGILAPQQADDLRIMDLSFEAGSEARSGVVGWNTEVDRVLLFRLSARGFSTPFGNGHWETPDPDGNALVECDVADTRDNAVYIGGAHLAVLGNDLRNSRDTHILRVWQAHRAVIQHNELSGSSLESGTGRHALKLHGIKESEVASTGGDHLEYRTRYVIVSHNTFGSSGPWPVTLEPQDGQSDERLEDILFEGNRILPGFGQQSSTPVTIGLSIWARHCTVRNNVFTAVGAKPSEFTAVAVDRYLDTSLPVPEDVRILNNTIYMPEPGANQSATGIVILGTSVRTQVGNNLVAMPGEYPLTLGEGQETIIGENLVTPDARLADVSGEDLLTWDFSLGADSPAIDGARALPIFDDFAGNPRPVGAGYDFGAFERQ